jgi:hypothetical protein
LNRRTGELVSGHQRTKTLPADAEIHYEKKFETPTAVGTVAHGYIKIGEERFTYREVDWDETKATAAMVAANAHGGEWDEAKLQDILKELQTAGNLDIELTGFDLGDVYAFMGDNTMTSADVEKIEKMSEALRAATDHKKEIEAGNTPEATNQHYYLVLIFRNNAARESFTEKYGLEDETFQDARKVETQIKGEENGHTES